VSAQRFLNGHQFKERNRSQTNRKRYRSLRSRNANKQRKLIQSERQQ